MNGAPAPWKALSLFADTGMLLQLERIQE